jgi:predicted nucleic acid-binding protein
VILVDTSVLSRAFRRRRPGAAELKFLQALERLMTGEQELGIPAIVLLEILSGVRGDKEFAALQRELVNGFAILHASTAEHVDAAKLRSTCAAQGVNVSALDCLIAVQTISGGHQLLAVDRDFALVARHSDLELVSVDSLA